MIAIISLLSSVVLASLRDVRNKAAWAKFDTEFLQIRTAIELYRTSNGGNYPPIMDDFVTVETVVSELYTLGYLPKASIDVPPDFLGFDFVYAANTTSDYFLYAIGVSVTCGKPEETDGTYTLVFFAENDTTPTKLPKAYFFGTPNDDTYCIEV